MTLSPQWLDELRARITLSSVVMRTTKLQRAGREWKACCPFHDENTPSFYVNDQKGFYHCFGCQQHGDVIRWMTDQRGLGFMDAVKELAAEAGLDMPAPDPRAAERAEQRAGLADVTGAAQDWFVRNLHSGEGAQARAYLERRGFDAATIERFGFGYAPADRQALKGALGQFDEALLVEAGMRVAPEEQGRENYDRFRSRIMLPIQDARGRVIGFGGRILDAEANPKAPKYLNSPDTPLFDKGRNLYNLHRASPASRKSGRMIVVEGYMDVIALAAAGIEDAVAPMGTALTEGQIELLWRHVETPILCFDGDAAGQRAAVKSAGRVLPMLRPAHSLGIVHLPSGLDPDDLVRTRGRAAMDKLLAEPAGLLDTLWLHEREAQPLDTPEAKAGLKARLLSHIDDIEDGDIRALYKRELLERFSAFAFPRREWKPKGFSYQNDNEQAKQDARLHPSAKSIRLPWDQRDAYLYRRLGAAVTAGLLRYPELLYDHYEGLSWIESDRMDPRLAYVLENYPDNGVITRELMHSLVDDSGFNQPTYSEWDKIQFPFATDGYERGRAIESLEMALRLYYNLPRVKYELQRANLNLADQWSDGAFSEQKRLLQLSMSLSTELQKLMKAA